MPEINLRVYHFDVAYSPVEFAKQQFRLWLPERASVYIDFQGHRYQRVHRFSQFQLFLVNTNERVAKPVPPADVSDKSYSVPEQYGANGGPSNGEDQTRTASKPDNW